MAAKTYAEFEVKVLLKDLATAGLKTLDSMLESVIKKSNFDISINIDKNTQKSKQELIDMGQGADTLRKKLSNTNKTIAETNNNLLKTHGILENVSLLMVSRATFNLFGDALKSSADFEHQLSVIRAITNATTEDMGLMEAKARELGATTLHTATAAAQGMEVLARAGLNANEVLDTIPSVLSLATAAELELAEASQFLVNTANQMKIPFTEVERIADVLQATSATSSSNVRLLGGAMNYVGPAARLAGLDLEQTAAVLGLLHDNGIRGTRAGRGLRQVLSRLTKPTSKVRKALEEMGYSVDDLTAFLNDMGDASEEEVKHIAGMFGLVASPTIITLIEEGGDAIHEYSEEIRGMGKASSKAAAIMTDDLQGSFTLMTSAWDAARQAFTEPLTEDLRGPLEDLTNSFRQLAEDDSFKVLGQSFSSFITLLADGLVNIIQLAIEFKGTIVLLISVLTTLLGIRVALFFAAMAAKVWTFVVSIKAATIATIANTASNYANIASTNALTLAWGRASIAAGIFGTVLKTVGSGLLSLFTFKGITKAITGLGSLLKLSLTPIIAVTTLALKGLAAAFLFLATPLGIIVTGIAALGAVLSGIAVVLLITSRNASAATNEVEKLTEAELELIKAKEKLARASAKNFDVEIKSQKEILKLTVQEKQEYTSILVNALAYLNTVNDGSEKYTEKLNIINTALKEVEETTIGLNKKEIGFDNQSLIEAHKTYDQLIKAIDVHGVTVHAYGQERLNDLNEINKQLEEQKASHEFTLRVMDAMVNAGVNLSTQQEEEANNAKLSLEYIEKQQNILATMLPIEKEIFDATSLITDENARNIDVLELINQRLSTIKDSYSDVNSLFIDNEGLEQTEANFKHIENSISGLSSIGGLIDTVDFKENIDDAKEQVTNLLEKFRVEYQLTQSFINSLPISEPFQSANSFTKKLNESVAKLKLQYEITQKKITSYNQIRILEESEIRNLTVDEAEAYKVLLNEASKFYNELIVKTPQSIGYQKQLKETTQGLKPILEGLHEEARAMGKEISDASLKSIDKFNEMRDAGYSAGKALSEIWKNFSQKINVENIRELAQEIINLEYSGVTAEVAVNGLREGLESLSVSELQEFQSNVKTAFENFEDGAKHTEAFLTQTLGAAFKFLKIDIDNLNQGITESGGKILRAFDIIAANTLTTTEQMAKAIEKTFKLLGTTGEFDVLKQSLKAAFDAGVISVDLYNEKITEVEQKILSLQATLSGLDDDFKTLNIKSVANITESLEKIEEAYQKIQQAQRDGTISTSDLKNAFVAYANKKLALSKQINSEDLDSIKSTLASEAAYLKVTDKVKDLKESYDGLEESKNKAIKNNSDIKESIESTEDGVSSTTGTILAYKIAIEDFAATSVTAVEKFKDVLKNTLTTLPSVMDGFDQYIGNFDQYFQQMGDAYDYVAGTIENQEKIQQNLESLLGSNIILSDQQLESLEGSVNALDLLDDSSLDNIRGQLETLKERSQELKDTVLETVETLRDEFKALSDVSDDIDFDAQDVTIEYLEKRNELQQQYNKAIAIGDAKTIAGAKESLELSEKIYKINLEKVTILEKLNKKIQETGEFTRDEAETIKQLGSSLASVSGTDLTAVNKQISDFVAKITALSELRESVKATLDELDTSAANDLQVEHYDKILELEEKLRLARELNDAQSIKKLEEALEITEQQFNIKFELLEKETNAYENIRKALLDSNDLSLNQVESMQQIVSSFELLSESDLGNTVDQLDQLATKIEDLNNLRKTIKDTLAELDTSTINNLQIEHYEKILKLEEQLIEAKRLNDSESIANVKQALELTNEQYSLKFESLQNEIAAHEEIKLALTDSNNLSLTQVDSMKEIVSSFELLGESDLGNVKNQLDELATKITTIASLRATVKKTLDAFNETSLNVAVIENYNERLKLEELLATAQKVRDTESIKNIELAIKLTEQQYSAKIDAIEKETIILDNIKAQLSSISSVTLKEVNAMDDLIGSFEHLNDKDLSGIKEQIDGWQETLIAENELAKNLRNTLADLTDNEAEKLRIEHLEKIVKLDEQLSLAERLADSEHIESVKYAIELTNKKYNTEIESAQAQQDAYEEISSKISDVNDLTDKQVDDYIDIIDSLDEIEDSDLSNLHEQLTDVNEATETFRDTLADTVENLEKTLLRELGEEQKLTELEYQKDILEIEEQLQQARKLGDTESIQAAQKALGLRQQIHELALDEYAAEKEAAELKTIELEKEKALAKLKKQESGDEQQQDREPQIQTTATTAKVVTTTKNIIKTIKLQFISPSKQTADVEVDSEALVDEIINILTESGAVIA